MPLIEHAEDDRPEIKELFQNLKKNLPDLEELLQEASSHWGFEDPIYRFYHRSFKVFDLQTLTLEILAQLQSLVPGRPLNDSFLAILKEGTEKKFSLEDNQRWLKVTCPILEAFFHARYFLEMAVKYGKELKYPPKVLPSGWAALLYLYNLR